MTTVTVLRQAVRVPDSPLSSITLTQAWSPSELEASLSGPLTDYDLRLTSPGSDPSLLVITAKWGYKERFRKSKAELEELKEKVKDLEAKHEILERDQKILEQGQIYSLLLTELNDVWWPKLPNGVCTTLLADSRYSNLPHTLATWFLQWEKVNPTQFPAPLSLRHFGPITYRSRGLFILDARHQESNVSRTIGIAWDAIPEATRELMLFCWAGSRVVRPSRNSIAHPAMNPSSVKMILGQDFNGSYMNTYAEACQIADYLFL